MRIGLPALLLGVLAAGGCATSRPAEQPAPPPRVKLAILPVESDAFPRLAAELNRRLQTVKIDGVDDYFLSKVTLEVVQISIECVEDSAACLSAAGKSLSSDRLLTGRIVGSGRRRDKSVKLVVTLFDVPAGAVVHSAQRSFANEAGALQGMSQVLEQAVQPAGAREAQAPAGAGGPKLR
jgi:hypothetical protein